VSQDAEDRMRGWLDRAATRMSEIGALLSDDVAPASSDSPSLPPPPGSASGALLPLLPAAAAAGAAPSGSSTVSSPVGESSTKDTAAAPGTLLGIALTAAPATASRAAQQQPADAAVSRSMAGPAGTAAGAPHQGSIPQMPRSALEPAASGDGSVTSPLAPQDSPEAAGQQEQDGATAGNAWLPSPTPLQTLPPASASAAGQPVKPTAIQAPLAEPAGASPAASVGSAPSPSPQRWLTPLASDAPDSPPPATAGGAVLATQTSQEHRETASDVTSAPAAASPLPAISPEAARSDAAPSAALPSPMRQPSQGLIELLDGFNGSSAAKAPVQPPASATGDPSAAASVWDDEGASPQQRSRPPSAAALRAHAAEQSGGSEASEEVDSSDALLQQVWPV
jgi:hypothetical protein